MSDMPLPPEANSPLATKTSISIRVAKIEDLAAVLRIEQSAPRAAHWGQDHYRNRILDQPREACFLVAGWGGEGRVQGFLCARIVEAAGEWEIENVVVDEEFRRQGIGTQLMQLLIRNWEDSAGTALLLEVRESNTVARGLYERQGLGEVGRRRAYYRDPSEDAILYARYRRP
jgi:ribosomal-protein-alanine acetyltransferase